MEARWAALTVLTAARVSMGFQFQSVASVSPFLASDLGMTYTELGSLIGLYVLPGVALALPGGLLGRRFGDRNVVACGLLLMTLGGAIAGFASGYSAMVLGRLISGSGAILMTVLMMKMITDWFAGREIVLAMAIMINAFSIGVGVALLSLGSFAEAAGWRAALNATAMLALASFALLALAYRAHPNDRQLAAARSGGGLRWGLAGHEARLVGIAGMIFGTCNGALAITYGFTPLLLTQAGTTVVEAGFLIGAATWLTVASVQIGGLLAQKWRRPNAIMLISFLGWGACLLLLPTTPTGWVLLSAGILMGLPVGVIVALPSEVLRPEARAAGLGLFQTVNFACFALLPALAGRAGDVAGGTDIPLYLAGSLVLSLPLALWAFRALQQNAGRG
jgi:predicted MFS family arabinose efflux permease